MAVNETAGYGLWTREPEQIDKEILYSMEGRLKKGGVIAQGQVLASGTVLGRVTASGEYVAYDDTNTDGSETAVAILARAVDTTLRAEHVDIYFAGTFKTAALVGLDAAAIADLGATQDTVYGFTRIP